MTPAEIKFRGFRTDGGGWVEGLLNQYQGKLMICREVIEYPTHSDPGGTWIYQEHEIHPESLGMFTGEHDMNGREIFGAIGEKGGDRCKFMVEICGLGECVDINIEGVVVFENGSFVLNHHEPDIPNNVFVSDFIDNAEIIGNQWEADNGR